MSGHSVGGTHASLPKRYAGPALTAVAAAGSLAAVAVRDPNIAGSWPVCPSLSWFGVLCPLCGGLRSAHALTELDLAGAVSSNIFVPVLVATTAVAWLRWVRRLWRDEPRPPPTAASLWAVTGGIALVYTVLRNLPAFSVLAP